MKKQNLRQNLFEYVFKSFNLILYSNKDREDLENLEDLVSLENQVNVVRLQDKLGKQNFHEGMKKVFEPVTKSLENTSENLTKLNKRIT